MELSELQKNILNSPSNRSIVMSSAASGKTTLMTEKVRQLLRAGVNPKEIAVITFTNMAAAELRQRLGQDYKDGLFVGTIHALANWMLLTSGIKTDKVLNNEKFDELFLMVEKNPTCIKHMEWVLLDEAQDTDEQQFRFLFDMINPDYFFIVGDIKQCQPEGTMIQLASGETRAIEDLVVGDQLITYDVNSGRVLGGKSHNATNCKVLGIDAHIEDEPLVKVTFEDGNSTMYSYNHKTLMCLDDIRENFLVYLMCDKNNRFRVGKSQFKNTTNTNIYRAKMRAEGCQKIWILKTFKTDKEARVYEDKISCFYRIPQVTFQLNKTTYTQEDIDYIYDGLDTYQNALNCLHDHYKYYDYPFCSSNDNNHFASNAYGECYACNLIAANMSMLQFDPDRTLNQKERKKRIAISHIEHIAGAHRVYSLNVEKTHTYIADNIITHNCIYRWRAARPDLLQNMAKREDVTVFDLNENYRNGYNILNYAKNLIRPTGLTDSSISKRIGNGSVKEIPYDLTKIINEIRSIDEYKDWAILTRTNQEILTISSYLNKSNIPYDTFKQGDLSKDELNEKMNHNTVKLLTVHSAKGLEWRNVIVVGMRYTSIEERSICYVAATRAMENLIWVNRKTAKKKPTIYDW